MLFGILSPCLKKNEIPFFKFGIEIAWLAKENQKEKEKKVEEEREGKGEQEGEKKRKRKMEGNMMHERIGKRRMRKARKWIIGNEASKETFRI